MRLAAPVWPLLLLLTGLTARASDSFDRQNSFSTAVVPVGSGHTGFTRLAAEQTGLGFTNVLPDSRSLTNQILPNGSGVAAGDVDGDGWCDLYFCGLNSDNKLYRNLGQWRFQDITAAAGVACAGLDATGAALADLDGDRDLDLIVNSIGGGTHLFLNNGRAHFEQCAPVLNEHRGGTSLALADVDGDGDLDVYVVNYRSATIMDAPGTRFSFRMVNGQPLLNRINGKSLTDPEWTNRFVVQIALGSDGRGRFSHEELGEPDALFLNDGRGGFKHEPFDRGTFRDERGQLLSQSPFDWGLAAMFRDFNGDGWPDLYVCNDFGTPDRFWLNDGQGRFRAAPALTFRHTSLASMALDTGDLNRDGFDDVIVVDMLSRDHERRLVQRNISRAELAPAGVIEARPQYPRNTVFLNRGDGTYAEIAPYSGLEASEWSWNPILLDVDLDGFEDVLVPNGFIRDNMNLDILKQIDAAKAAQRLSGAEELRMRRLFPVLNTPNVAFRNLGQLRFAECGAAWGFADAGISQGACLADLDNDGDMDVVLNNLNSAAGIYRNDSSAPRVAVRLRGLRPNTAGIGARIRVTGGPVSQSQEIICGGRYLSSDQPQRAFAAGASTNRLTIEVDWRRGKRSVVRDVRPDSICEIEEPLAGADPGVEASKRPSVAASSSTLSRVTDHAPRSQSPTLFEDVSDRINHRHQDALFDDFARQPLLTRRLSQLGPGVAWWDLDGDGRDDLMVGAGRGGKLAAYRNNGQGAFERLQGGVWDRLAEQDQSGLAGWEGGRLLVGVSNYEVGSTNGPAVELWSARTTAPASLVPGSESSTGPLAVADYDGDGDLDLFVGGRVVPGRYPESATSRLFLHDNGRFRLDAESNKTLEKTGLVSGALFSDLDGDGKPELILACEWGPILIFRYETGVLKPWNWPVTLAKNFSTLDSQLSTLTQLTGWWNGITSGDFDGDGALDLLAANWGHNSYFEHYGPRAVRVYYGDYDRDGIVEIIEAGLDDRRGKFVPDRSLDRYARAMPFLTEAFPTYAAWAKTDIDTVLKDCQAETRFKETVCRTSLVLLNRHDHFEAVPLPLEAQLAPAFAACVADADGDGREDVFLSQNFFGRDTETSRDDAGRGLWLRGDGHAQFEAVPAQASGVTVYGEQRGAAVADFDGDGRVDLVVTQNNAATKLYRNRAANPGLRVRLQKRGDGGPVIGAVVRLKFGDRFGPAREVRSGSGYWSQDSPLLVLAQPEPASHLWVRWPGGRTTLTPVPVSSREITVTWDSPEIR
ncbi:MAG: VCBS repeat-containing protein [Verrucomicrobia bacterium]|nr:VCBS repeat-containing protein [Verrucomicrobiota bacterium]